MARKKKPKVDAKYVYDVANKYYPGIQAVLADLEIVENARELIQIRAGAAEKVEAMVSRAKQEEEMNKIIQDSKSDGDLLAQLQTVVANITNIYDEYTVNQIEEAFYKVTKKKSSSEMTEKEITRAVIEKLQSTKKKSKNSAQRPDLNHMQDFINKKG